MNITPEQLREMFEKWANPDRVQVSRTACGSSYYDSGMSAGWSAWQAAFSVFQKLQESEYRVISQANRDYQDELKAQSAELALQNQVMREALEISHSMVQEYAALLGGLEHEVGIIRKALKLPDLAADILAEHDAKVLRDIADKHNPITANELRMMADKLTKLTKLKDSK